MLLVSIFSLQPSNDFVPMTFYHVTICTLCPWVAMVNKLYFVPLVCYLELNGLCAFVLQQWNVVDLALLTCYHVTEWTLYRWIATKNEMDVVSLDFYHGTK